MLEYPFPIYGRVTNGLGLPISGTYVRVYDTRDGYPFKDMLCDENGYYQMNIQDKIEDYNMDAHIETFYNSGGNIINRHYYFDVLQADMSKEINFRISEKYVRTDNNNIGISIL